MLDVLILNRNLGTVCDALIEDLQRDLTPTDTICVVDAASDEGLKSAFTTVTASDPFTRENGLRFGRGMNLGLKWRDQLEDQNPWVLMLPVDTDIVDWNMSKLLSIVETEPALAAVKPLEPGSPFIELLGEQRVSAAWHLEEGPWLVRDSFIQQQRSRNAARDFFDHDNFRGYLTSLELSFRAYANGWWVAATDLVLLSENESLLVDRAELIHTEPIDVNRRLLLEEGIAWLRSKYGIDDPWSYAQLVRLLHDRFVIEHPELHSWSMEYGYSKN